MAKPKKKFDFDSLPFISGPNPLPCGCGIKGHNFMNRSATKTESRGLFVAFCPIHAAAPRLKAENTRLRAALESVRPILEGAAGRWLKVAQLPAPYQEALKVKE